MSALAGVRVLVPVTEGRRAFAERLRDLGAEVVEAAFIAIEQAADPSALDAAVARWCHGHYDWMAVTSRNTVVQLEESAARQDLTLGATGQVAVVGAATLAECERAGLPVALVPTLSSTADGLVAEFPAGTGRVLAPMGNLASQVLPRGLSALGWAVEVVEAYRTVDGAGLDAATRARVAEGGFDAVVLTSGSVAARLAKACPQIDAAVVVMGLTTQRQARRSGIDVDAVAAEPTYDAVIDALESVTVVRGTP